MSSFAFYYRSFILEPYSMVMLRASLFLGSSIWDMRGKLLSRVALRDIRLLLAVLVGSDKFLRIFGRAVDSLAFGGVKDVSAFSLLSFI